MKRLPSGLAAHLASGATTMAYCWRITRRDATVLGFTEHDRDIACDGTTFAAATGFTGSQIEQGLGLSIDNLNADGALSSDAITETDILTGRYDDATIDLLWVNWSDPSQFVILIRGNLGEVKRTGIAFSAELRSLASRLNQRIGRQYQRTCSAKLGDSQCGIDLTDNRYHKDVTASASTAGHTVQVSDLSAYESAWFTAGVLRVTGGANAGIDFEIKTHIRTAGADFLELWRAPPFAFGTGDTARALAGCRKTLKECSKKFDNVLNFRGFPYIPPADVVTRYPVQGGSGQDGGSLFRS